MFGNLSFPLLSLLVLKVTKKALVCVEDGRAYEDNFLLEVGRKSSAKLNRMQYDPRR